MHVYYAGAQTKKDPRESVKRDLNVMSTFFDFRKCKRAPKFIRQLEIAKRKHKRRSLNE